MKDMPKTFDRAWRKRYFQFPKIKWREHIKKMIPNNKEKFAIACISISRHSMMCSSHKDIKTEPAMFYPRMNHTLTQ
jgi:hypothetical protein